MAISSVFTNEGIGNIAKVRLNSYQYIHILALRHFEV